MLDLDRLHNVFHGDLRGRGVGVTTYSFNKTITKKFRIWQI